MPNEYKDWEKLYLWLLGSTICLIGLAAWLYIAVVFFNIPMP